MDITCKNDVKGNTMGMEGSIALNTHVFCAEDALRMRTFAIWPARCDPLGPSKSSVEATGTTMHRSKRHCRARQALQELPHQRSENKNTSSGHHDLPAALQHQNCKMHFAMCKRPNLWNLDDTTRVLGGAAGFLGEVRGRLDCTICCVDML